MKTVDDLRIQIAKMVKASGEGHIPSSYSIVDIIDYLYEKILKIDPANPSSEDRDYFILSKGHGCGAFYAVLHKYGFLTQDDLKNYSSRQGILGGHPDCTKVPGAEASTGSLGHGFPTAMGVALGLKIKRLTNKVYCLVGDGECHEGTIWESANVATNLNLNNLCLIVDWNGSAEQLMPKDDLPAKWEAFGWDVHQICGHSRSDLDDVFKNIEISTSLAPKVILAKTVKGKGVSFLEGHGKWHHKIPDDNEMRKLIAELS